MTSTAPQGWEFLTDARDLLASAGDLLAADPLQFSRMVGWAAREVHRRERGQWSHPEQPYWYGVHRSAGRVDGVAMRTAPFAPHPLWVPPMAEDAARDLGRLLVERGEVRSGQGYGVNGMAPAAAQVAEEVARGAGAQVHVLEHTRLLSCKEVRHPPRPLGRLRQAGPVDLPLVVAWLDEFERDATQQAGRVHDAATFTSTLGVDEVTRRLVAGAYWLYEDAAGEPVHLTAAAEPSLGISAIGPVYTPGAARGRGYAGWTVAELTQRILAAGAVPFLFTDRANPVSNRLYTTLGYRVVTDAVELLVR